MSLFEGSHIDNKWLGIADRSLEQKVRIDSRGEEAGEVKEKYAFLRSDI